MHGIYDFFVLVVAITLLQMIAGPIAVKLSNYMSAHPVITILMKANCRRSPRRISVHCAPI
jgi:hypothetical protein